MTKHRYVEDPSRSIVRGPPLADETELGTLTVSGFLRDVTERFADREALVHRLSDGTIERWSYADLWSRSLAVAKALVACGLGKGECVGVLMTNRAEFLSAVFGTALAGGVASPLSTFSTPSEIEHLVATSACSVLLIEKNVLKKDFAAILHALEPALADASAPLRSTRFPFLQHVAMLDAARSEGRIATWPEFVARGAGIADEQIAARAASVKPADPGMLFFSSGSTGKPKGIVNAHRAVATQMWRMRAQQALDDGVRTWTANGFFWSGNFAMALGATLAAGGSLVLQRVFKPAEALEMMAAERATFLFAWPHQWAQLIESPDFATTDLAAMVHVDVDSLLARNPSIRTTWVEPRHCYGNTETFTLSTAYPANTPRSVAGESHGPPLPGITLKIVNPLSGDIVPIGARGEIAVKGATLMLGYVGVPLEETLDEDGFFRTGDGGHVDAEGRLFWEGRLNDIIKTGGANVSPIEIDEVIRDFPGVKRSQTVGVPDDLLGELVVACVIPQSGSTIDEAAVREYAREKLASYKVPRRVLVFEETDLQLTGSAKIKTADLRALAASVLASETAPAA